MAIRQMFQPNINTPALRGWCLKYVDDAGNVPNSLPPRTGLADTAYKQEVKAGRIQTGELPVGIWVPIFLSLTTGPYKGMGHVALARQLANGQVEIHDSEVHAGARKAYNSIAELLAWYGNYKPKYLGWSTHCDSREYAQFYNDQKDDKAIAREVIAGKWGNGEDRRRRLTQAGYDFGRIQSLVNQLLAPTSPARKTNEQIADEVIRGEWGNNPRRSNQLAANGYDPRVIQDIVNRKLRG